MLKKEFIEQLESLIMLSGSEYDEGKIRLLFCTILDCNHRDSDITDAQARNWILTDRELAKLKKVAKIRKEQINEKFRCS